MPTAVGHGAAPTSLIVIGVILLVMSLFAVLVGLAGRKNPQQRWWLTAANLLAALSLFGGGIVLLVAGITRAMK